MTDYLMLGERARWSVMWVTPKGKRHVIIEHECGADLTEAIRVYNMVKAANKKFATLRCANVAFPPPAKYQPQEKTVVTEKRVRGRLRKVKTKQMVDPMVRVNDLGYTWCPYCRELRSFDRLDGFRFEGIWVPEPGYRCFMCGISSTNHYVRKYNPGVVHVAPRTRTRRTNGSKSTRRR